MTLTDEPAAAVDRPNLLAEGGYVAVLAASECFTDHTYQRPLSDSWIRRKTAVFDRRLLGALNVSDRGPDWAAAGLPARYALVDGQHRHALAVAVTGDPDVPLAVTVHEQLTVAQEAALCAERDRGTRKLTTWERWVARRAAGDPDVAAVERVAARHGLRFATGGAPGAITAVSACEQLYRTGGEGLLDACLAVLRGAWRTDPTAYTGSIMGALAALLLHHGSRVDMAVLTDALRRSAPWSLRQSAHAYRTQRLREGTQTQLLADAMADRYNRLAGPGARLGSMSTVPR